MGVIEFFLFVVVVVLIGWLCIYGLATLAPGHPAMIDNIIWLVVILLIVIMLANAVGIVGHDPMIPRLR